MFNESFINENGFYLTYLDLIGYVAILFSILGFMSKTKNGMRTHGMISTAMFGTSIYQYNGLNGLFVSFFSFFTKLLSIFIEEKKLKWLKYSSPFIAIIFYLFFNEEGIIGLFPAISLVFIIIADLQETPIKMKQMYYGSAFSWLLYGILLGSIPAILFDVFGIITLYLTIRKLKNENKQKR